MSAVAFADVVHQLIEFSTEDPGDALVLKIIDTPWFQRLRDISQTANTKLVYMFAEHTRFGHCVGVAYLAKLLIDKLIEHHGDSVARYRIPVLAAAALHDIGHLAPGSHAAFKAWFPNQKDSHESLSRRVILEDKEMRSILESEGNGTPDLVAKILDEDESLPPWTWEIISGGGWNVDRGNWCVVDSVLAGVSYGKYNIPALTEAMRLTPDGHLALHESRLDAMMHFAVSRHAMYRQVYQHRVLLAADVLAQAVVRRARDLGASVPYADATMEQALGAKTPEELSLHTIAHMRECWWRYHLMRWQDGKDEVLRDLSSRLLNRRLFKTVRIHEDEAAEDLTKIAARAVKEAGFDPAYYLHTVTTSDVQSRENQHSMLVQMENGEVLPLSEAEPLVQSLVRESGSGAKRWLALPAEAKARIGRKR